MKTTAIVLLFAFTLALSANGFAAIMINEVMYNPAGDDNNREFVEVIGTGNLSGFVLGDNRSNDSLVLLKFVPGNISLVVESGFDHSRLNCSVYSAGNTIGNNLNNKADKVFLYLNGELIDWMQYNNSLGNNKNRSLELVNGSWLESCSIGGSPCSANCVAVEDGIGNETIDENETENDDAKNLTEEDSRIVIDDIITPAGGLHYGDSLEVELYIYRGNTLKSVVTASLKDENNRKVSDELKFKLTKKYTELSTVAEFHIKEVCAEDETYTLIVEGLGVSDEENVRVWQDNKLCDEKEQTSTSASTAKKAASTTNGAAAEKSCKIISFYTRVKKYSPNITLYANTDCSEGELLLTSKLEAKTIIINSSGTLGFQAEAEAGNNIYTLKLLGNEGELLNSKELNVTLEGGAADAYEYENDDESSRTVVFEERKNLDEGQDSASMASVTGGVVYESSNVKLTKIAPVLVVVVTLLTIGGFKLLKKKEKLKDESGYESPPLPPKTRQQKL